MKARRMTDAPVNNTNSLTIEEIKAEAEELHAAILASVRHLSSNLDNLRPNIVRSEILFELEQMKEWALKNIVTIRHSRNRDDINEALTGLRRKKTSCLDLTKTILLPPPPPPVPNSTLNILTSFAVSIGEYLSCLTSTFAVQTESPEKPATATEDNTQPPQGQMLPMSISTSEVPVITRRF